MEKRKRIGKKQKVALLMAALIVDLISFVPILNIIVTIFAWFFFWIWFALLRVSRFRNANRFATMATATIIELIPMVSIFPAWIWSTYKVIKSVQEEDDKYNKNQEDNVSMAAANDNAPIANKRAA